MWKFSPEIVYIIVLAMVLSIAAPLYKGIVSALRFDNLAEKKATKDVVVQSQQLLDRLDVSDYERVKKELDLVFIPSYNRLVDCIDGFDSTKKKEADLLSEAKTSIKEIEKLRRNSEGRIGETSGAIKDLYIWINGNFKVLESQLESFVAESQVGKPGIIAIDKTKVEIKKFTNFYGRITIALINRTKEDESLSQAYSKLAESVRNIKNNPLFDMDTPYFSLPVTYAEEKEREIFEYLVHDNQNQQGLMALVLLYLRMNNISDAESIFVSKVYDKAYLSDDEKNIREYLGSIIVETTQKNPTAIIQNSLISVGKDFGVTITEKYNINSPSNAKKVLVLLPYQPNKIVLKYVKDQLDKERHFSSIVPTWKGASYFSFDCDKDLYEFTIQYTVKDFFLYSTEYGKYYFKYGGISANRNFHCAIVLPNGIRPVSFISAPDEETKEADRTTLGWSNPLISFKIGAIDYESRKSGIGGEVVDVRTLYEKMIYSLIVFFLFTIVLRMVRFTGIGSKGYQIAFISVSILVTYFLNLEAHYLYLLRDLLRPVPIQVVQFTPPALMALSILSINGMISGGRHFQMISAIVLIAIEINVVISVIENSETSNILAIASIAIFSAILAYDNVKLLEEKMEISRRKILFFAASLIIVSVIFYNSVKTVSITEEQVDFIGLVLSIFVTIYLLFAFVINNKRIRNEKKIGFIEVGIDILSLKMQGRQGNAIRFSLLAMLFLSSISPLNFVAIVIQLIGSVIAPSFLRIINHEAGKTSADSDEPKVK